MTMTIGRLSVQTFVALVFLYIKCASTFYCHTSFVRLDRSRRYESIQQSKKALRSPSPSPWSASWLSETISRNDNDEHRDDSTVVVTQNKKPPTILTDLDLFPNLSETGNRAKRQLGVAGVCAILVVSSISSSPSPSFAAYEDSTMDTVESLVKKLDEAAGNQEKTFTVLEELAAVITEGKGLGEAPTIQGVQLNRGEVTDEDTAIYNPGLSILTESEKDRLVESLVKNKKTALSLSTSQWSDDNQLGYEFVKGKLDPFHTYELRGYLGIFPFYSAAWYVAALAVQRFARELFPAAYIVGALAVLAPVGILVALGP